jgi:histone H3/H4
MVELPRAPVYRIMKRAGAERVSEEAVDAMIEYLEEVIEDLTLKAIKAAEKAGRKTVRRDDVEFIVDILKG